MLKTTPLRLFAALCTVGLAGCSSSSSSSGQHGPDGGVDAADDAGDGGCPADRVCGGQCCPEYYGCGKDPSTGASFCAIACDGGAICPTASPCCDTSPTGGKQGLCMPNTGQTCICHTAADCVSAACAPAVDSSGNITGAGYVCVPDDGQMGMGCNGPLTDCTSPACCVTDKAGNRFCSQPCTSDSTCGKGHCDTLDFSSSTCTGDTKACGI